MPSRNPRRLDSRTLAEAYDGWYSQWSSIDESELDDDLFSYHLAALELAGDQVRGRAILDISCGDGRLTCELARRGAAEVTGIDISKVGIEIAEARAARLEGARIALRVGDIEDIPAPDRSFDTVFCCETLEHVLSPSRALAELERVLIPGGTLVLTVPNYLGPVGLLRLAYRVLGRPYTEGGQPVNRLTMWPLTLLWVRRAGFRVNRLRVNRLVWPRRGAEPRELSPPIPIARLLRPFGLETAISASRPIASPHSS